MFALSRSPELNTSREVLATWQTGGQLYADGSHLIQSLSREPQKEDKPYPKKRRAVK